MRTGVEERPVAWHLWAKWENRKVYKEDPARNRATYWLPAHLADTAIYANRLLTDWVPPRLLERFQEVVADDVDIRQVIIAGAAFHDLGKATPVFQGKQLTATGNDAFAQHLDMLGQQGIDPLTSRLRRLSGPDEARVMRRHETAGAVLLSGQVAGAGADGVAALIGGHHGRWHIPTGGSSNLRRYVHELTSSSWTPLHANLMDYLADLLHQLYGFDLHDVVARTKFIDRSLIPTLTGVVTLADWLASNHADQAAAEGLAPDRPGSYQAEQVDHAARNDIEQLLGTPRTDRPAADLFPYPLNRPVQIAMQNRADELPPSAGGALHIVQVPMGEGKTEAALSYWASRFRTADRQGLYFALPTMATASAMFDRVRDMFAHYGVENLGALAHSQAALNAFCTPADTANVSSVDQDSDQQDQGGLIAGEWFQGGRHRPLLAPIAVGTVDQLLSGVLRNHYSYLRLLAASTKTIILDEVHSYDPYMQELLRQFLTWAGHLRIDVTLLTATLPTALHDTYLQAYTAQQPSTDPDRIDVPYPKLTATHAQRTYTHLPAATYPADGRKIEVIYHPASDTVGLMARLRAAHPNARLGLIVNTVRRAQTIGRALANEGLSPIVLHARFPAAARHRRTELVLERFGEVGSGPELLVATQLAEQSLNIDVDIMVVDLCPAPSLVQRIGRCHRYPDRDRGTVTHPTVYVLLPDRSDGTTLPHLALPYHPLELDRCRNELSALLNDGWFNVPVDVQALLDRTHLTYTDLLAADLSASSDDAADVARKLAQQKAAADDAVVPDPATLARRTAETLSAYGTGGSAQTRWFEQETCQVVLVGTGPDLLSPGRYDQIVDHGPDDTDAARELLSHTLNLPRTMVPPTWDGNGAAVLCPSHDGQHIYDSAYGLERNPDVGP